MLFSEFGMVVLACLTATNAFREKAVNGDTKRLQGSWVLGSVEYFGQQVPSAKIPARTVVFKGDKIRMALSTGSEIRDKVLPTKEAGWVQFRLNPMAEPKHLDLREENQVVKGIYAFDGDKLRLGLRVRQESFETIEEYLKRGRPTSFQTSLGHVMVLTFQRQSP